MGGSGQRGQREQFGGPAVVGGVGGVSNVAIAGKNTLQIKAIGVTISTFETLPVCEVDSRQEFFFFS